MTTQACVCRLEGRQAHSAHLPDSIKTTPARDRIQQQSSTDPASGDCVLPSLRSPTHRCHQCNHIRRTNEKARR
ncbi:hypothetical protein SM19410_11955 [Xanthomonas hortorum pv. gardneri]|nr:hypothetical protein BJD10_08150 [Xanthomonas hortorum pv. gardneri]KLA96796.1 hypothetical protein SM19410_11955 [Xanthomonas hortorum pv. gardneri]KLB12371.1 hypothetical protein SM23410_03030 [Xanthomonas hortorum pv. gardneri]KLB14118.1 hypothetical protein SM22010_03155 [Xanthomonas hortorum pv. gardneri]KLB27168.1 hypothetical protein SM40611_02280 [Xanthomonas hortorum pv. gardneri]